MPPLPGQDGITQRKFLARLQGEVFKLGTIDVLRNGLKHGPHHLDLFYGTPSPGSETAQGALRAQPIHRMEKIVARIRCWNA